MLIHGPTRVFQVPDWVLQGPARVLILGEGAGTGACEGVSGSGLLGYWGARGVWRVLSQCNLVACE